MKPRRGSNCLPETTPPKPSSTSPPSTASRKSSSATATRPDGPADCVRIPSSASLWKPKESTCESFPMSSRHPDSQREKWGLHTLSQGARHPQRKHASRRCRVDRAGSPHFSVSMSRPLQSVLGSVIAPSRKGGAPVTDQYLVLQIRRKTVNA